MIFVLLRKDDTIRDCAPFLERFQTIPCAEAAARDTRNWDEYDLIRARNPMILSVYTPKFPSARVPSL